MKTIKLLLGLLAVTALSCSTDNETETATPLSKQNINIIKSPNDSNVLLKGTWEWIQTFGGFIGTNETPASTGNTKALTFTGGHSYQFSTNGVTTSQGTYSIGTQYCMHYGIYKPSIHFSDPMLEDLTIESVYSFELILSDDYADGYTSRYIK